MHHDGIAAVHETRADVHIRHQPLRPVERHRQLRQVHLRADDLVPQLHAVRRVVDLLQHMQRQHEDDIARPQLAPRRPRGGQFLLPFRVRRPAQHILRAHHRVRNGDVRLPHRRGGRTGDINQSAERIRRQCVRRLQHRLVHQQRHPPPRLIRSVILIQAVRMAADLHRQLARHGGRHLHRDHLARRGIQARGMQRGRKLVGIIQRRDEPQHRRIRRRLADGHRLADARRPHRDQARKHRRRGMRPILPRRRIQRLLAIIEHRLPQFFILGRQRMRRADDNRGRVRPWRGLHRPGHLPPQHHQPHRNEFDLHDMILLKIDSPTPRSMPA